MDERYKNNEEYRKLNIERSRNNYNRNRSELKALKEFKQNVLEVFQQIKI